MQEVQETRIRSLGQADPLEEEMATHSVFLPGESHGQRRLVGYGPRGRKESDTTGLIHTHNSKKAGKESKMHTCGTLEQLTAAYYLL